MAQAESEQPMSDTKPSNYLIERDNARPLLFVGTILAQESSHTLRGEQQNRWVEYVLYRTVSGKLIAQTVYRTRWQGQRERYEAKVCNDYDAVIEAFGLSDTAKDLYKKIGLDVSERID